MRGRGNDAWLRGFVWTEWNAEPSSGAIVPRLPSLDGEPMSNVDPLVFGPRMYFDYCRKGRSSSGRSLESPNSLEAGDLVLFAGAYRNKIWIDTIFAIGATRQWPTTRGIPAWEDIGDIAARVHFHEYAQQQHPEVRDVRVSARSYRSASDRDGGRRFAWVPWSRSVRLPFELGPASAAFQTLQRIYAGKDLYDGFTGSFAVTDASETDVQDLFDQLLLLAHHQGFGCAVEIELLDRRELALEASGPDCGSSQTAPQQRSLDVRGPLKKPGCE